MALDFSVAILLCVALLPTSAFHVHISVLGARLYSPTPHAVSPVLVVQSVDLEIWNAHALLSASSASYRRPVSTCIRLCPPCLFQSLALTLCQLPRHSLLAADVSHAASLRGGSKYQTGLDGGATGAYSCEWVGTASGFQLGCRKKKLAAEC